MEFGYGFELNYEIRPNFGLVIGNLEWHWWLIVGYPSLTLD
jgi:hypothetical protein